MPTATQITVTWLDLAGARCAALFCSGLQPSDAPTAGMVATAISRAVKQFGVSGCASRPRPGDLGEVTIHGRDRWHAGSADRPPSC